VSNFDNESDTFPVPLCGRWPQALVTDTWQLINHILIILTQELYWPSEYHKHVQEMFKAFKMNFYALLRCNYQRNQHFAFQKSLFLPRVTRKQQTALIAISTEINLHFIFRKYNNFSTFSNNSNNSNNFLSLFFLTRRFQRRHTNTPTLRKLDVYEMQSRNFEIDVFDSLPRRFRLHLENLNLCFKCILLEPIIYNSKVKFIRKSFLQLSKFIESHFQTGKLSTLTATPYTFVIYYVVMIHWME
jgi:hypothetical protein